MTERVELLSPAGNLEKLRFAVDYGADAVYCAPERFGMRAAAGNTLNLNPTLLLDAFAAEEGVRADWMRVVRTAVLDQDGNPFE